MSRTIKITGAQMEPVILANDRNLSRCLAPMETAAKEGRN